MRITYILVLLLIGLTLTACQSMDHVSTFSTACEEPRSPICTMNYLPVCGHHSDNSFETYANACTACSNTDVLGYSDDSCVEE